MTLADRTPSGKRAARSYFRRCLAVMLCCVLVFSLTFVGAPKAQASPAAVATTAGLWAADSVASSVGAMALTAGAGLDISMLWELGADVGDRLEAQINHAAYYMGYALAGAIKSGELSEAAVTWMANTVAALKEGGGVLPGAGFIMPADVAEEIRLWALDRMNFVDGQVVYDSLVTSAGFVLSDVDTTELDAYTGTGIKRLNLPVNSLGSFASWPAFDCSASYSSSFDLGDGLAFYFEYVFRKEWSCSFNVKTNFRDNKFYSGGVSSLFAGSMSGFSSLEAMATGLQESLAGKYFCLFYSPASNRLYAGVYYADGNFVSAISDIYVSPTDLLGSVTTTIKETAATSTPVTKDMTVTVPADLPVIDVGGYSVPVIGDLTAEDLLTGETDKPVVVPGEGITAKDITGAITDALPITGAIAGDQVVEETMRDPDSLGAVFVSRFPFCIPWDIAQAVGLLAAPPEVPRFELDFLAPIGYRVGGWNGSTKVVLDFSDFEIVGVFCRWLSSILFGYALASGTKRMLWTA